MLLTVPQPAKSTNVTIPCASVPEVKTKWNSIRFGVPGGEEHNVAGAYHEVALNQKLVFSWAWQSTPERVSRVTVLLRPKDGGTELNFRHEQFFDQAARDGHNQGWAGAFAKLDRLLGRVHAY